MSTPISGTAPYCTPQQFVNFYDVRPFSDLMQDQNIRLSPAQVLASPVLLQFLGEASGWFESACFTAAKYSQADIQAVVNQGGNGTFWIAGIVGGIAQWAIYERRPQLYEKYPFPKRAELAMLTLDRLRLGERILPLQEKANAGLPASFVLTPAQVFQQNLATTEAYRFFGQRGNQITPGSGYPPG